MDAAQRCLVTPLSVYNQLLESNSTRFHPMVMPNNDKPALLKSFSTLSDYKFSVLALGLALVLAQALAPCQYEPLST